MSKKIVCIIKDKNQARQAIEQLNEANISNISILCKCEGKQQPQSRTQQQPQKSSMQRGMAEDEGSWEREEHGSSFRQQSAQSQKRPQGAQSKQPEQLPGLNTINVPGLGQTSVSGQFQNLLKNPSGSNPIASALSQLGIPENQASKLFDKINKNSNILLLIQADSSSDIERAREILEECNASDIVASAEKAGAGSGKKSQQW